MMSPGHHVCRQLGDTRIKGFTPGSAVHTPLLASCYCTAKNFPFEVVGIRSELNSNDGHLNALFLPRSL